MYVGLVKEDINWNFEVVDQDFQDSKALSEQKRTHSYELLMQMRNEGLEWVTGQASAQEIDHYGMTRALNIAIIRGLYQLFRSFLFEKYSKIRKKSLTFDQVRA